MARLVVTFTGANTFGLPATVISVPGVKVGDQIISSIDAALGTADGPFQQFVTVDGQILQLGSSGDHSGQTFKVLLRREVMIPA